MCSSDLTAFQNEALRVAREQYGGIALEADDVQDRMQRLTASWVDLKIALGQGVLPLVGPTAEGLRSILSVFAALPGPVQRTMGALIILGSVTLAVGGGILLLAGSMAFAVAQLGGMAAVTGLAATALGALSGALGTATGAAGALNIALGGFLFPVLAAVAAFAVLNAIVRHFTGRGVIGLAIEGARALWERLQLLPDVLLLLTGPLGAVIALFRHWDEIVQRLVGGIDRIRGLLPSLPEVPLPSLPPEGLRGLASSAVSTSVSNVQRTVSIGKIEVAGARDPEKVAEAVMRKIRNQFEAA